MSSFFSFIPIRSSNCQLFQTLQCVRVAPDKKNQGGGLRPGFGAALLPLLQRPHVDPQLARENGSRATQSPSGVAIKF
jgi:hypothetical protein